MTRVWKSCVMLFALAVTVSLAESRALAQELRNVRITIESDTRSLLQGQDNGHLEYGCEAVDVPISSCTYQIPMDGIQLVPYGTYYWGGNAAGNQDYAALYNVEGGHQLATNLKWEFAEHRPNEPTYRRKSIAAVAYWSLWTGTSGIQETWNLRWEEEGLTQKYFDWPFNFGPYIETCLNSTQPSGVSYPIGRDGVILEQWSGAIVDVPIKISVSYDVMCTWYPPEFPPPPPPDVP